MLLIAFNTACIIFHCTIDEYGHALRCRFTAVLSKFILSICLTCDIVLLNTYIGSIQSIFCELPSVKASWLYFLFIVATRHLYFVLNKEHIKSVHFFLLFLQSIHKHDVYNKFLVSLMKFISMKIQNGPTIIIVSLKKCAFAAVEKYIKEEILHYVKKHYNLFSSVRSSYHKPAWQLVNNEESPIARIPAVLLSIKASFCLCL